jgi:phage regulator Rha-like protein
MKIALASTSPTMTSIEIADLLACRHDKVKQSIDRLSSNEHRKAVIQQPPVGEVKNHLGQSVSVYLISKRDSYVIVAQLSPEFTAKLVDRWQELESKQAFTIPQTLPEALRLAADLADQLAIAAPKVAVYELLADRKGDVCTTIIAKELGTTAIKLNRFLRDKGVKWQKADLPKAGFESWFNVVADIKNDHEFTQCLVTPTGQIEIAKMWQKSLV